MPTEGNVDFFRVVYRDLAVSAQQRLNGSVER